jgi:hypothetical protein
MAQKVYRQLVDDLVGGPAVCTAEFGLFGAQYEAELNQENLERLEAALEDFVNAGRKVGGRVRRPRILDEDQVVADHTPASTSADGKRDADQSLAIRDWARQAGFNVADRGRIRRDIIDAYEEQAGRRAG